MEWQTFSKRCQLKDRLTERGVKLDREPRPADATRKLHILVYGDSVDRVLLEDACDIGRGKREDCLHAADRAYSPR